MKKYLNLGNKEKNNLPVFPVIFLRCVPISPLNLSYEFKSSGSPGRSLPLMVNCQSPNPATRDSTWRNDGVGQWDSLSVFYGLPIYSKFKILFYTFTKTLGQTFDIFSSPSPRFIIFINHSCSSNRVPASGILLESALSSIIYLL